MKDRAPTNVAHSVHERLLNRARENNRPFNELLQHYAIERFLYRLGQSPHTEKLLLKGALLLRVWKVPMARPTMDIDVLGRTVATPETLVTILKDCMTLKLVTGSDQTCSYSASRLQLIVSKRSIFRENFRRPQHFSCSSR